MKRIILWILVISWMGVIFYFSSENAEKSTDNSRSIITSTNLIEKYDRDEENRELVLQRVDTHFRKFAHAFEFLVLSILVCFLIKDYTLDIKKILLYAFIICFLYSISDEIHQLYVIGRSCELRDIIIDNIGSFLGMIIFYISGIKIWRA